MMSDAKNIKPRRGGRFIASLIAEGEHEHQDFKHTISDPFKIARSISAFANNDGGRLLIGVRDNGTVAGLRNDEDIYVVEHAALSLCDPPQQVEFASYIAAGNLLVICATISAADVRPVRCRDTAGKWHAYYRVADNNMLASPLMVRAWRGRSGGDRSAGSLLTPGVSEIMAHIASVGDCGALSDEIAVATHRSRVAVDRAVIALYGMGLIDFRHIAGEFRIVAVAADSQ